MTVCQHFRNDLLRFQKACIACCIHDETLARVLLAFLRHKVRGGRVGVTWRAGARPIRITVWIVRVHGSVSNKI
jgi:hypothetical protein